MNNVIKTDFHTFNTSPAFKNPKYFFIAVNQTQMDLHPFSSAHEGMRDTERGRQMGGS